VMLIPVDDRQTAPSTSLARPRRVRWARNPHTVPRPWNAQMEWPAPERAATVAQVDVRATNLANPWPLVRSAPEREPCQRRGGYKQWL